MKLLVCPACEDVKKLDFEITYCKCKKSYGRYLLDGHYAEVGGKGYVIGVHNQSLLEALASGTHSKKIECWLIMPHQDSRVSRLRRMEEG